MKGELLESSGMYQEMCWSAVIINQGWQALSRGLYGQSSARSVSQLSTSQVRGNLLKSRNRASHAVKQHPSLPSCAPCPWVLSLQLHPSLQQVPSHPLEPLPASPQLCPTALPSQPAHSDLLCWAGAEPHHTADNKKTCWASVKEKKKVCEQRAIDLKGKLP